eukprot:TRINITY_DN2363_c0_g1_i1.p1 TRINITY_DN2363_c0_g1~~TRINITY_DN2363_c0_g1_i1.p1  ORF type:complete len:212 (-),score=36.81 TRINITY_DN2363_c0_g1_i1:194-829(-)
MISRSRKTKGTDKKLVKADVVNDSILKRKRKSGKPMEADVVNDSILKRKRKSGKPMEADVVNDSILKRKRTSSKPDMKADVVNASICKRKSRPGKPDMKADVVVNDSIRKRKSRPGKPGKSGWKRTRAAAADRMQQLESKVLEQEEEIRTLKQKIRELEQDRQKERGHPLGPKYPRLADGSFYPHSMASQMVRRLSDDRNEHRSLMSILKD